MTIASSDKFKKTVAAGLATLLVIASAASIDFNPEKTAHLDTRTSAVSMLTDLTPEQEKAVQSFTTYSSSDLKEMFNPDNYDEASDIYLTLGNVDLNGNIDKSAKDIINLLQSKTEINKQTFTIGLDGGLADIQNSVDQKPLPHESAQEVLDLIIDEVNPSDLHHPGDVSKISQQSASLHSIHPNDYSVEQMEYAMKYNFGDSAAEIITQYKQILEIKAPSLLAASTNQSPQAFNYD